MLLFTEKVQKALANLSRSHHKSLTKCVCIVLAHAIIRPTRAHVKAIHILLEHKLLDHPIPASKRMPTYPISFTCIICSGSGSPFLVTIADSTEKGALPELHYDPDEYDAETQNEEDFFFSEYYKGVLSEEHISHLATTSLFTLPPLMSAEIFSLFLKTLRGKFYLLRNLESGTASYTQQSEQSWENSPPPTSFPFARFQV